MTKGTITSCGKVWSGDIEAVPADLTAALAQFTAVTHWTGGGEIEYIEGMTGHAQSEPFGPADCVLATTVDEHTTAQATRVTRWVVDFNPRFPAWIFASTYADCNLPALLVQAAERALQPQAATHCNSSAASTSDSSSASAEADSGSGSGDAEEAPSPCNVQVRRASFVRSVVEVPLVHVPHSAPFPGSCEGMGSSTAASKAKAGGVSSATVFPYEVVSAAPNSCVQEDHHRLQDATLNAIREGKLSNTPKFVLSVATMETTLHRLRTSIEQAAVPPTDSADQRQVPVQLCLSVKTQPSVALLQSAREAGYYAECISMAEVYHAVLHGGYVWSSVVLTGPGKFWDCMGSTERAAELTAAQVSVGRVHAVFADSLADLQDIVQRLLDPTDPLDTEVVGLRWCPTFGVSSRFGLDCKDAKVVRAAAEAVRRLPDHFQLGMHLHHAPSVLGMRRWLALAQGFVTFCREFSTLCGRPVATLDLGGGFEPYGLESSAGQAHLQELLAAARASVCDPDKLPTVQFELGKCVSEPAGCVVARVLALRERDDRSSSEAADGRTTAETARALIIDSTVADLSVPNSRCLYWLPAGAACPIDSSTRSNSAGWTRLQAGRCEVWGRTCMEWDRLVGTYTVPAALRAGDLILITGAGAYDLSMQYNFGDGRPRTEDVVMV
jgi:diaminopimelate decarboxylase